MTMIALDTLRLAKKLKDAGMSQAQAEAVAEAQAEALSGAAEHHLATKEDVSGLKLEIQEVRTELKTEIQEVRTEIHTFRSEMIKWISASVLVIAGMFIAQAGILVSLLK